MVPIRRLPLATKVKSPLEGGLNVPRMMADPEFFGSVFNNLFINALQAMESGGGRLNIKLSPDDDGEFVNFEISDTGNGIPAENLSTLL